ncbi:hypothetical protein [Polymorphum gilvum]|uniref:Uncharacterized protein n=1 Tax=Polymorphum gilvum (strain LMG 25793 / CGMCC 1.9160 / SL003B-26A1) TaxID=991905 RepID=F2J2W6_POLGS|nr:hypothetical protein [Polymorphum gilvum]ADZ72140.1 hypothetical protein SL003B_3719 [Polymorphum gilvum SL003B-26A1]
MKFPGIPILAGLLLVAPSVAAQPAAPDVKALITAEFIAQTREWLANPIVPLSVTAQNELRGKVDQAMIDALDKQWVDERKSEDKPLISATLSAPLSTYLLRIQAQNLGLYTEIFVMDANGLNVGQSAITGDYWQGDEAKFQKTFPVGPQAVFIDEPEWDDEHKIWAVQLNLSLADATGSKAIGAATVEVNLTELQRRNAPAS